MSDSGNYELEDIVWEMSDNDDHIVPYAGARKNGYAVERGCFNRLKELKSAESNADDGTVSVNVSERKEEASFSTVKEYKKTMLENSLCPLSSNGGSPASLDVNGKRSNLHSVSDEEMPTPCLSSSNVKPADSELCADNPDLGNQAFPAENDLKQYQLNDASHTENDLAFLDNGIGDEGKDDLFFNGWPELENFEDIDNMLRDCDPTFSLDIDNDDDLSWLSSSHMTEGANPFGLNSVTEQQEVYGQSNNGMVVDESNNNLAPADGAGATHNIVSQSQMHSHVSPSKQQKSSEEKSNVRSSESGVSFNHFDMRNEVGKANQFNSQHNFSRENQQQQQKSSLQPCLQTRKAMIKAKPEVGQTSAIIESEVRALSTTSLVESSHASNQIKPMETSRDASLKNLTSSENKKKGKLHQGRLSRHAENSNSSVQRVNSTQFYANETIPSGENEGQSKVDNSEIRFKKELDSSTIQEGSSTSSVLNEVSIDESSLMLLQNVMGQLDIRTKLCIRDSLYRLARSAAQRHIQGSGGGDDILSGTNKCSNGFVDMETDTNPIDRSIAHWLFHRPSDPSASAAVAVKSKVMVKAPNPLTADKSACKEETNVVKEDTTKQRN